MEWNQAIRLVSVGGRVDPKPKAGIKPGPAQIGPVLGKVRNGNRLILRIDTRGAGSRTERLEGSREQTGGKVDKAREIAIQGCN